LVSYCSNMHLRHGLCIIACTVFVIGCVSQLDQDLEPERCTDTDGPMAQRGHSFIQVQHRTKEVLPSLAWLGQGGSPHKREPAHDKGHHDRDHTGSIRILTTHGDAKKAKLHGERAGEGKKVSTKAHKQTSKHKHFSLFVFNFALVILALVLIFLAGRQLLKKKDEGQEQVADKGSLLPTGSLVESVAEKGLGAQQELLSKNDEEREQKCGTESPVEGLLEEGLGAEQERVQAVPVVEDQTTKAEPDMVVDDPTAVARTRKESTRKSKKAPKDKSGKTQKTADQAENLAQPPQTNGGTQACEPPKHEELSQPLSEAPRHQNDVPGPDPDVRGPEDADGTGSTEVLKAPSLLLSVDPDLSEASAIEDRFEVDLSSPVPASDNQEVSIDSPLIAEEPEPVVPKVAEEPEPVVPKEMLPLSDRLDALKELNELKARQEAQNKVEEEQRASVASAHASLEKLEADEAKMKEEEDNAEKAFKLLPYKARSGASTVIGKEFWASSSWRARLAAAQEAQENASQPKIKASRKARSKKNSASQ